MSSSLLVQHNNNTLLSISGTVTPARWVHSQDIQMTDLISNQTPALPFWSYRVASITAILFWCFKGMQPKIGLLSTVTLHWPLTSDNPRMWPVFMSETVTEKQPVCYFNHFLLCFASILIIAELSSGLLFIITRCSPSFPDIVVASRNDVVHVHVASL